MQRCSVAYCESIEDRQAAEAQECYRLAKRAGAQIAEEEDRQQFQKDLAAGPWFAL